MSQDSSHNQQQDQPIKPPTIDSGEGKTSGKAIASLVLGLLSFVGMCFTGVPGLMLGILGLGDVNRSNGRIGGKKTAIFGIVLSSLGIVWTVVALLIAMILPAVHAARSAARQEVSTICMKRLALSMVQYQSSYWTLPPRHKNGLSWRVHLLPMLGEQALYERFHLDEPWDSPHNIQLLSEMPSVYACPSVVIEPGFTVYQVPYTDTTANPEPQDLSMFNADGEPISIGQIADGTMGTISLLEVDASAAVQWTKPADWEYDPSDPKRDLGSVSPLVILAACADGSCHRIPVDISPEEFKALITRAAGDAVPAEFTY